MQSAALILQYSRVSNMECDIWEVDNPGRPGCATEKSRMELARHW